MKRIVSKIPKINLVEVGPRDGLQNERKTLSINQRAEFLEKLQACGFTSIEAGSFVSPKSVPQMANTSEVLQRVQKMPGVTFSALVPNMKGWEAVPKHKVDEIVFFMSATEGFNRKNLGSDIAGTKRHYENLAPRVFDSGMNARGSISCCWVCPFDGPVKTDAVLRAIEFYRRIGVSDIDIADTIGVAAPEAVSDLMWEIRRNVGLDGIAGHFHDSKGHAVDNILAAAVIGVKTFHSSIAGIGGCPFSPNRVGNVATEKVLDMFGWEGIDTEKFWETQTWLKSQLA